MHSRTPFLGFETGNYYFRTPILGLGTSINSSNGFLKVEKKSNTQTGDDSKHYYDFTAIIEISTLAPNGNPPTCTVSLAGAVSGLKNWP